MCLSPLVSGEFLSVSKSSFSLVVKSGPALFLTTTTVMNQVLCVNEFELSDRRGESKSEEVDK